MNGTIPILTKLTVPKPLEWYKHFETVQQHINSTYSRSVRTTFFELMIGKPIKLKTDIKLWEIIETEGIVSFKKQRAKFRNKTKQNLVNIQQENRRTFNKKRKKARTYQTGDLAIKRTQLCPGLKVYTPFLGPYEIIKSLKNNRYIVRKIINHEEPVNTSTGTDYMKPWTTWESDKLNTKDDEPNLIKYDLKITPKPRKEVMSRAILKVRTAECRTRMTVTRYSDIWLFILYTRSRTRSRERQVLFKSVNMALWRVSVVKSIDWLLSDV